MPLAFTPDGKRYIYHGNLVQYGNYGVVVDGKMATEFIRINPDVVVCARDSIRWAVLPHYDDDTKLVVDGATFTVATGSCEFQFSKNGKTLAYITSQDGAHFVVFNGKPHKRFTQIDQTKGSNHRGSYLILSDDGAHSLYPGRDAGTYYACHNTVWHELAGIPDLPLVLSPDGKRWAGRVGYQVTIDGKKGRDYLSIGGYAEPREGRARSYDGLPRIVFSPDSRHVAYAATDRVKDEKAKDNGRVYATMVRDGVEQKQFAWVSPQATFSADSRHLAYAASDSPDAKAQFVTVDGVKLGPTTHDPVFSPDSKSLAWRMSTKGETWVVLDEQNQKTYDSIGPNDSRVGFTPDGAYTYVATREGAYYLVEARRK